MDVVGDGEQRTGSSGRPKWTDCGRRQRIPTLHPRRLLQSPRRLALPASTPPASLLRSPPPSLSPTAISDPPPRPSSTSAPGLTATAFSLSGAYDLSPCLAVFNGPDKQTFSASQHLRYRQISVPHRSLAYPPLPSGHMNSSA
ncbi:hypothetical protein VTO73DRAFT_6672 [Trametes versicolor]